MKFLLTTTFFVVALLQCAYATQADGATQDLCDRCKDTPKDDRRPDCQECKDLPGGLDDDEDDELTLISMTCDEEKPSKFSIDRKAALMCNLVKNIIEGDKTADEIEIKKVNGPILNLVVEYLKHHDGKVPAEITKPIRSVKMEKLVEYPWDAEFINKQTKAVVFKIILGANYMDIKSLLHLGCAKIATLIKGKSPEEIKKILGDDEDDGDAKADTRRRRLLEAMSKF